MVFYCKNNYTNLSDTIINTDPSYIDKLIVIYNYQLGK